MSKITAYSSGSENYAPTAIYYVEADCLEYVRHDEPCVYRRIDELLTLILDMDTREPCGFKIKGFRNIYSKYILSKTSSEEDQFPRLVNVFERVFSEVGDDIFKEESRKRAYEKAHDIAEVDQVVLTEWPEVA